MLWWCASMFYLSMSYFFRKFEQCGCTHCQECEALVCAPRLLDCCRCLWMPQSCCCLLLTSLVWIQYNLACKHTLQRCSTQWKIHDCQNCTHFTVIYLKFLSYHQMIWPGIVLWVCYRLCFCSCLHSQRNKISRLCVLHALLGSCLLMTYGHHLSCVWGC